MSEWATKRLDVEASLAVSTAMASQQVDEMARYLDDAYAKIEALQNQTNLLNEEANTLNEENDRLAAQVAERNESIVGLREQVQELGNTIVHLENERQNNSFSRHMSTLDASSHHRMQSRLNRSSRGYFAPSKHRSCAPLPETVKPSPTLAPPHESDSYASLRRQRDNLIALQNGGVIGLESALSAIEAKLDALQCSLPLDGTASPIAYVITLLFLNIANHDSDCVALNCSVSNVFVCEEIIITTKRNKSQQPTESDRAY